MIGTTNAIESKLRFGLVTDGLVLHLDGIENTRHGHNSAARTWEDLSGNNIDWTLPSAQSFSTDYLSCPGGNMCADPINSSAINSTTLGANTFFNSFTYQTVLQSNNTNTWAAWIFGIHGLTHYSSYFIFSTNGTSRPVFPHTGIGFYQITMLFPPSTQICRINNSSITSGGNDQWGANTYTMSGVVSGSSINGKLYSVRVYNRILTDDELYANWIRDKNRFNIPD